MHDDANLDSSSPTDTLGVGLTRYFLKCLCPFVVLFKTKAALALPRVPVT